MKPHAPIYLDYAAATPMDDAAVSAVQTYQQEIFFNPSASYQSARHVRQALETARAGVASVLGCKDQEVIFTAGGTEANNLAIHGIMRKYPAGNLLVSSIEHESVLEPAAHYERKLIPVNTKGIIDLAHLQTLVTETTVLISVMYANNEIGTIQPLAEIAQFIKEIRAARAKAGNLMPLYLHTDACQAANYLDLQVTRLKVDMMTLNGGKIYAPKQSGMLYVRAGVELEPLINGGAQERSLRSGTENVGSQIAFATMLHKVQDDRKQELHRLNQLRDTFFAILSQNIPEVILNGDSKKRLSNNLNILVPGVDGERLLMELDELGIMVATGSACTASSDRPSHVLVALGLSPSEASASLRVTLGRPTTLKQIEQAAEHIATAVKNHQKLI